MSDRETEEVYDSDSGIARGPGAVLREARVARGVSVEEIATDLRIELHLLHALENEDYPSLGAPVFAKGYIRQYASRLGVDAGPLIEQYTALSGHSDVRIQPSRVIKLRDTQQITVWIVALLALALIVVFLLVWWFDLPARFGQQTAVTREAPAAMPFPQADATAATAPTRAQAAAAPPVTSDTRRTASTDVPTAGAAAVAASGDAADGAAADSAIPPPAAQGAVARETAAAAPESATGAAAGAPDAPAAVAQGAVALDAGAPDAVAAPVGADGPTVEIVFTADCWAEIEDANGVRLLYGLIAAGERHTLAGTLPLDVFLGNADAASITVDGREFTVPGRARRGNLARFAIDSPTN